MKTPGQMYLTALLFLLMTVLPAPAADDNGFELTPSRIDTGQIYSGGPPRDGIPPLDEPVFHTAVSDNFLFKEDRILGLEINGIAKAYPTRILNWHEIVNDTFGETAVAVTYCPLCGTGAAFLAEIEGENLEFGVSGLLYNSDVLLYDRQSESLWSQIKAEAVTGRYSGTKLTQLELIHTTWHAWQKKYPNTVVLSSETGYFRDSTRNPYQGYEVMEQLYFPVAHTSDEPLHPKKTVLGVAVNGTYKAYPFSRLEDHGKDQFIDTVGGRSITIYWDADWFSARAETRGEGTFIQGFWFDWYAFHPDTELFIPPWLIQVSRGSGWRSASLSR